MRMNRNTGWALLLIFFGGLILLHKFGAAFGLYGLFIPAVLLVFGWIGLRNNSKVIGWAMIIIAGFMLLPKLAGLGAILIAAALIVYGVSLLGKRTI